MKYIFSFLFLIFSVHFSIAQKTTTYLFVGTYTDGKPDKGIYIYTFNSDNGVLKPVSNAENIINPSFITLSADGRFLYSCIDTKMPTTGSIAAFEFDSTNGKLNFLNKESSGGANPVNITVHSNDSYIIIGNYTDASVTVLSRNSNGTVNPYTQTIPFTDSSINKDRQDKSHIHCTVFSPDFQYLYLPDLGADKIRVFKFETERVRPLIEQDNLTVHTIPGSGPRHLVFQPNKRWAYCTEEMSGMISAYSYQQGKLSAIQRIFSYSKQIKGDYSTADIHTSPDGKFLYASNRGENTISIFSIHSNGKLKLIGHHSTMGATPRNFTIDPTGNYLLVANQTTNNIVVLKRDSITGLLESTGNEIKVPNPSCVIMRAYLYTK